ncbi:MAG: hypothetical protein CM1200mP30_20880 [Pseudomonadota bacterium]|nr:MAG: hypothetical protein CM1200mP30_20880 [Pseudomonadota bacterium]
MLDETTSAFRWTKTKVALGRAIVRNPQVFLMDEPLSNLDALLRLQTRKELIELTGELKSTVVYVLMIRSKQ